jgi:hypothetical protein
VSAVPESPAGLGSAEPVSGLGEGSGDSVGAAEGLGSGDSAGAAQVLGSVALVSVGALGELLVVLFPVGGLKSAEPFAACPAPAGVSGGLLVLVVLQAALHFSSASSLSSSQTFWNALGILLQAAPIESSPSCLAVLSRKHSAPQSTYTCICHRMP